ncbi:MAG: protein translocase subunit SecF [Myxococcaceae bacterium]|nr:protein translocase subunit SecF [Myxococcaceae bacterium]MCI0672036.1 protein translocase subunit SecF [Myxococcaceae bacterium]
MSVRFERPLSDPAALKEDFERQGVGVREVRSLGESGSGGFEYQVVAGSMAERAQAALAAGLSAPDFETRRVDYVGPQVGKQLRNKAVVAVLLAMVAILCYVAFRFDFRFAPGAIVAMVHDTIMVAGYYLLFQREFTLTAVAALLTIVGYSINDKVVIFDRVREEMVKHRGKPLADIINIAVNATLSRTLLTGGIATLSLVGLLVMGVGDLFDFAVAMVVGIVVGTYSSIYIASPLTLWLDEREAAKKARERQRAGQRAAA